MDFVVNVTDAPYCAAGDGVADDRPAIQAALDDVYNAGGGTVVIPTGSYALKSVTCLGVHLFVRDHTKIIASPGALISRYVNGAQILTNYNGIESTPGYSGHSHITVEGGTWDGRGHILTSMNNNLTFMACEGITIRDMTVKDAASAHGIEINSSKNVLIENVAFRGWNFDPTTSPAGPMREAIQIDTSYDGFGVPPYDGTPVKNVIIRDCTMDKSENNGPHGTFVGSHAISPTKGSYLNIKVLNNTILDHRMWGISARGWAESLIQGNTIMQATRPAATDAYGCAIKVLPEGGPTVGPVSGTMVLDNTIIGCGWVESGGDYSAYPTIYCGGAGGLTTTGNTNTNSLGMRVENNTIIRCFSASGCSIIMKDVRASRMLGNLVIGKEFYATDPLPSGNAVTQRIQSSATDTVYEVNGVYGKAGTLN